MFKNRSNHNDPLSKKKKIIMEIIIKIRIIN